VEPRDAVNLVITTAWLLAALACWFQPQIAASRLNAARPGRGPVSGDLRIASTATCVILALATVISIPVEHRSLPAWLGQGLALMGAIALVFTLIILFRERLARGR